MRASRNENGPVRNKKHAVEGEGEEACHPLISASSCDVPTSLSALHAGVVFCNRQRDIRQEGRNEKEIVPPSPSSDLPHSDRAVDIGFLVEPFRRPGGGAAGAERQEKGGGRERESCVLTFTNYPFLSTVQLPRRRDRAAPPSIFDGSGTVAALRHGGQFSARGEREGKKGGPPCFLTFY